MAVKIAPVGRQFFLTSSGAVAAGYYLFTYAAGTSTKQTTYTDSTGGTGNANPIVLNSAGRAPSGIWLTEGLAYKFVLAPSTDTDPPTSPVWTEDNIRGTNDTTTSIDQWVASALTPTYISATSFSFAGDQTSTFHPGRKLKTTNSGGTVYTRIVNSVFGAVTTITVENDSGTLDSGLSAVSYSLLSASNDAEPWAPTRGVAKWSADALGPDVRLTKSRASAGGYTIVQSGDVLGQITAYGADGSAFQTAARITFEVDATPGASDMPGRIVFKVTPDGSATLGEVWRIDSSGCFVSGGTALSSPGFGVGVQTQSMVIQGNSTVSTLLKQSIGIAAYTSNATHPAAVKLGTSRSTTIGTQTIVQLGDQLGRVDFHGSDGTQFILAASIHATSSGTPGVNDMPGSLLLGTTADGGNSTTTQVTISDTGLVTLAAGQIAFPATQNPSSGANTLDDYEEGTWTISFTFATPGDLALSAETKEAYYIKTGKQVFVYWNYTFTATFTTSVGNASLTGLPFTSQNNTNPQAVGRGQLRHNSRIAYTAGCTNINSAVNNNATTIAPNNQGSGTATSQLAVANFTTAVSTDLHGSAVYEASA